MEERKSENYILNYIFSMDQGIYCQNRSHIVLIKCFKIQYK